jgi:hypothetical protein
MRLNVELSNTELSNKVKTTRYYTIRKLFILQSPSTTDVCDSFFPERNNESTSNLYLTGEIRDTDARNSKKKV